jgi:preprotein translocase subunit SecG
MKKRIVYTYIMFFIHFIWYLSLEYLNGDTTTAYLGFLIFLATTIILEAINDKKS